MSLVSRVLRAILILHNRLFISACTGWDDVHYTKANTSIGVPNEEMSLKVTKLKFPTRWRQRHQSMKSISVFLMVLTIKLPKTSSSLYTEQSSVMHSVLKQPRIKNSNVFKSGMFSRTTLMPVLLTLVLFIFADQFALVHSSSWRWIFDLWRSICKKTFER